jgi:hypothetical protein
MVTMGLMEEEENQQPVEAAPAEETPAEEEAPAEAAPAEEEAPAEEGGE